jgi:hypothetical protein
MVEQVKFWGQALSELPDFWMISVFEASILAKPDPDYTKRGQAPFSGTIPFSPCIKEREKLSLFLAEKRGLSPFFSPFNFDFSSRKDYSMVRKETK